MLGLDKELARNWQGTPEQSLIEGISLTQFIATDLSFQFVNILKCTWNSLLRLESINFHRDMSLYALSDLMYYGSPHFCD